MSDMLFVCVHNAARSQTARAIFNHQAEAGDYPTGLPDLKDRKPDQTRATGDTNLHRAEDLLESLET